MVQIIKKGFLLGVLCCFLACKQVSQPISLTFLDEFIIPDSTLVAGTLVGGLSGIDYADGRYFIVSDDSKMPRYYEVAIEIASDSLKSVAFTAVTTLRDTTHYYDLESILIEGDEFILSSEGHIRTNKNPSVFRYNPKSQGYDFFDLPDYFLVHQDQRPRTNGVFEGLSRSADGKGYWTITELPLEKDGIAPTFDKAASPVRMTYFDRQTKKPLKQFVYELDRVAKPPKEGFAVNGVTDLLALDKDRFFVVERSYSSGHGSESNDIKIYEVSIKNTTNTLQFSQLEDSTYTSVTKNLLFDFDSVRSALTKNTIDNVEGLCYGPVLENGKRSLLLIVDNDFNSQGNRLNQLLLMQINE